MFLGNNRMIAPRAARYYFSKHTVAMHLIPYHLDHVLCTVGRATVQQI